MAEVDFGDSELFQQFDASPAPVAKHIRFTDGESEPEESNGLQERLDDRDDLIKKLTEENDNLRRKLKMLRRPSGIAVDDVNTDGPLLQVLFTNNRISKQCRQEIEDCLCSVILKHQKAGNIKTSSFQIKPQSAALNLEEDREQQSSSTVATSTEAFTVVGSVSYFTSFCVDKLGQPLVNENPQLTDGWDVPTFSQVFNQVVGADGQEIAMKDKRPKSMCFNCGSCAHQLRDCPEPKDLAAINERRKEFNSNIQSNQRYHADEVEERFAKYKPGVISDDLLRALGVDSYTLPPLIYRMRQLGYPPGWLKEAEMENSGLSLYDGKSSKNGSSTDDSQNISYDVSKLVDFPGFNVPAAHRVKDEFMHYGSIPMQTSHMKGNYASYLSTFSSPPGGSCNKRRQESDTSPQLKKKLKASSDHGSDMDIESDPGTPYGKQSDFQFQPPQPPGSPCFSTPPPLPQGTPPSTPTPPPLPKGTPPVTPKNGSQAVQASYLVVDETSEGTEDEMTLEELEEQQRLIWAALQNADSTSCSESDTPAVGTPARSLPSTSTPARVDTDTEDRESVMDTAPPAESTMDGQNKDPENVSPDSPPVKVEQDSPQSPESIDTENTSNPTPVLIKSVTPLQSEALTDVPEDTPESFDSSQVRMFLAVPHRSHFSSGIVPFEDTPEFTEVSDATGTYLRIRDLLKSSPRSLSKKSE